MGFLTDTTHMHIFTWVVAIVVFLVSASMAKGTKGKKITHMILRLFYILIIISGAALFFTHMSLDSMQYGIKFILGLLTIGFMEMVLVRGNKGKNTGLMWILLVVFLLVTLYVGFKLPLGFNFFA
ncbi:YisL family protein [Sporosarcina sp. GW1-11]|uniref:YisL family protein n=1 Tax=Sporosarcina sp. GW1-11 TaxID=2899126 RepID=UPI00294E1DC2|nr:YisL family protein [Sporosarcina sp. GW1-11]MDV6376927.1 YisL family protein [Sporosarcina sp. GW1-11]